MLGTESAISEQFLHLVRIYLLGEPHRPDEITEELLLLCELCNYHRAALLTIFRATGGGPSQQQLRTWLLEFATPPSGDWARLRMMTAALIRSFGLPPRPRGTPLFSSESGSQHIPLIA